MNIQVGSCAPIMQKKKIIKIGGHQISIKSSIFYASSGLICLKMSVLSSVPYFTSSFFMFLKYSMPQKVTDKISGWPLSPIYSGFFIFNYISIKLFEKPVISHVKSIGTKSNSSSNGKILISSASISASNSAGFTP